MFLRVTRYSLVEACCHLEKCIALIFSFKQQAKEAANKNLVLLLKSKMKGMHCCELSVNFQQTAQHHIPQDGAPFIVVTVRASSPVNPIEWRAWSVLASGVHADTSIVRLEWEGRGRYRGSDCKGANGRHWALKGGAKYLRGMRPEIVERLCYACCYAYRHICTCHFQLPIISTQKK